MIHKKIIYPLSIVIITLLCIQSWGSNLTNAETESYDEKYVCFVNCTYEFPDINAKWNKKIWSKNQSFTLTNFMGERPTHFPVTRVKLCYDKEYIYVIFNVKDNYIKAVAKETNGNVWQDSCVEFFFSPGSDIQQGYFNLETNCKGVILFQYHKNNGKTSGFVSPDVCRKIKISHSFAKDAEQEITKPETWRVEYGIPISLLSEYMNVEEPGPGVIWRANFYKCADKTSHPYWLTWAPVNYPRPKFHLPEFFGQLIFK